MTNFPNGVASFGMPVLPSFGGGSGPVGNAQTVVSGGGTLPQRGFANVWFVSSVLGSNGNAGNKMGPGGPYATLQAAAAAAAPGDVIVLLPGHIETVNAANAVDIQVKNLQVVGLGSGNYRPVFVFTTVVGATFRVSSNADAFYLYNVRFQGQIANQTLCFDVVGNDVTFDTVDYVDDTASDVATGFKITGKRCTIKNCNWQLSIANASTLQWITLNAANGFRCYNNYGYFAGKATANPANGVIVGVTAATLRVDIRGNFFSIDAGGNASVTLSLLASSTGLVAYNGLNSTGKTAIAGICALASAMGYQNFVTHTANKNGLLDPVVDA